MGVVCAGTDLQVCKLSYLSPRQVQVFCFSLTIFVAPVRPTSATSVAMPVGRNCLLLVGMFRRHIEDDSKSKLLGIRDTRHDVPLP